MQEVFPIQYAFFWVRHKAPEKRYLDFKAWALKFSRKSIPFDSHKGQHYPKPSGHACNLWHRPQGTTETAENTAENIHCAYPAVKVPSLGTLLTWVGSEIGISEALVIPMDGSGHARPWLGNAEGPRHIIALYHLPLQVQAQERWIKEG